MAPDMLHHSVLLQEVVDALGPADGHHYLDATFGDGGYSRHLQRWHPNNDDRQPAQAHPPPLVIGRNDGACQVPLSIPVVGG